MLIWESWLFPLVGGSSLMVYKYIKIATEKIKVCFFPSSTNKQTTMLLLLSSFSITLFLYFLIQSIIQINALSNQLHASSAPSVRISDCRLEATNIVCNRWTWAPVFIRVYLIGIFETIYIALCKRGLFKNSLSQQLNEQQVDTLVQSYENAALQTAVITGGDSGIGLEICKGLLGAGFHVIIGNIRQRDKGMLI